MTSNDSVVTRRSRKVPKGLFIKAIFYFFVEYVHSFISMILKEVTVFTLRYVLLFLFVILPLSIILILSFAGKGIVTFAGDYFYKYKNTIPDRVVLAQVNLLNESPEFTSSVKECIENKKMYVKDYGITKVAYSENTDIVFIGINGEMFIWLCKVIEPDLQINSDEELEYIKKMKWLPMSLNEFDKDIIKALSIIDLLLLREPIGMYFKNG